MKVRFIFLLLLISGIVGAQNLKKAFKYYGSKDYASAIPILNKLTEIDSNNAAPFYLLSQIYSDVDYHAKDFFKAYKNINLSAEKFPKMPVLEQDKIQEIVKWEQISNSKKTIEVMLYEWVKSQNSPQITRQFIGECNSGIFTPKALELLVQQEYQIAINFNSVDGFNDFISKYPMANEAKIARQKICDLEFAKAEKLNTNQAYQEYINKYPESLQAQKAKEIILKREYELAKKVNTEDALDRFIKKYPNSAQATELRKLREQSDYLQVIELNSLNVYNRFLNNYPKSQKYQELAFTRDSLAYQEAKSINTEEAYLHFISSYPNARQVPEVIEIQKKMQFSWEELVNYRKEKFYESKAVKTVRQFKKYPADSTKIENILTETFLPNGKLVKRIVFNDEGLMQFENFYTGKSIMPDFQIISKNGTEADRIQYEFSNKNLLISESSKTKKLGISKSTFYQYDERRNCIQKTTINPEEDTLQIVNFSYLKSFIPQEKITYEFEKNQQKFTRLSYFYNTSGILLQEIASNINDKVISVKTYQYNGFGQMIGYIVQNQFGKEQHTFIYNDFGLIEEEKVDFGDMAAYNYLIEYTYEFFE